MFLFVCLLSYNIRYSNQNLYVFLSCCCQSITESVMAQEDDSLLKCLIELSENVPKFLRSQLEHVFELCLKVCIIDNDSGLVLFICRFLI